MGTTFTKYFCFIRSMSPHVIWFGLNKDNDFYSPALLYFSWQKISRGWNQFAKSPSREECSAVMYRYSTWDLSITEQTGLHIQRRRVSLFPTLSLRLSPLLARRGILPRELHWTCRVLSNIIVSRCRETDFKLLAFSHISLENACSEQSRF